MLTTAMRRRRPLQRLGLRDHLRPIPSNMALRSAYISLWLTASSSSLQGPVRD